MNRQTRWLIIEATYYLAWARLLKALPFSKVVNYLGLQTDETTFSSSEEEEVTMRRISNALLLVSKHTWWESKCLVRGLAAMKMLERRGIASTIYFGTAKDDQGKLIAHAWLRSGRLYVTGAAEMPKFTMVRLFGKIVSNPHRNRTTQEG
ncbi:lasso peptide biosynthesis B2 protein [Paenibacillus sp. GCM10023250]|uniref:lasso peptide biosynthesis B2 protein n=1 Tax=Paenibacillus sp. GCM10023250 TaxID=3252648 RepID=UPI003611C09E